MLPLALVMLSKKHKEAEEAAREHARTEREAAYEISTAYADVSGKDTFFQNKTAFSSDAIY